MKLRKKSISLIASSDTASGASSKSTNGDKFSLILDDPISVPFNAKNVVVYVNSSSIWNTVYNIEEGVNNTLSYDYLGNPYTLTYPGGLYSLDDLNLSTGRKFQNNQHPSNLIVFAGSAAEGKIVVTHNAVNVTTDFTTATSFRVMLGFDSQELGPNAFAPFHYTGDNLAQFQTFEYFLIHGSICDKGIGVGTSFSQTMARVLIDAKPGSVIGYKPENPPKVAASNLAGNAVSKVTFWLTDQLGASVDVGDTEWSVEIVIEYEVFEK